jgi:tRNA-binding protein
MPHEKLPFIEPSDFFKADLRIGKVMEARPFPEARKPAYQLLIDFGPEIGTLKSSAQLTVRYTPEQLFGRLIIAVVNFPPRQIGKFMSECLVLGAAVDEGDVLLLSVDGNPEPGTPIA